MPARAVLHHVSIEVTDVPRSRWFYDRFLPRLGFRRFVHDEGYAGYTDGDVTWWIVHGRPARISRKPPTGDEEVIAEHFAFRVASEGEVRSVQADLEKQEVYPIFRAEEHPEFRPGYFSATWVDPDQVAIEVYTVPAGRKRSKSKPKARRSPRAKKKRR